MNRITNVSLFALLFHLLYVFFLTTALYAQKKTSADGKEFLLDTVITYAPADGSISSPAVTTNGTDYFVFWVGSRYGKPNAVFGSRVSAAGHVMDLPSLSIADHIQNCSPYHIEASSDGKNYLVMWVNNDPNILCKRIDQSGIVLDKEPVVAAGPSRHCDLVFNGVNYFIVYDSGDDTIYTIMAARITPSGQALDPQGILIATSTYPANCFFHAQVAFDGTNHLITWLNSSDGTGKAIQGVRADNNGKVIDNKPITIASCAGDTGYIGIPRGVAFDGTNYVVAWIESEGSVSAIHTIRVSPAGELLAPEKTIPAPDAGGFSQHDIKLAPDGTGTRLIWSTSQGKALYTAKIAKSGDITDSTWYLTPSSNNAQTSIAFNTKTFLVVYENFFATKQNIYGKFIPGSIHPVIKDSIIIPTQVNYQKLPSAAFDGKNYLVTWQDVNSISGFDIKSRRIDASGSLLDQSSVPVAQSSAAEQNPRIVHGSKEYLATWIESTGSSSTASVISGKRIGHDGSVMDPPLKTPQITQNTHYDLSFNGENYILAWANNSIYALRINQSCSIIDYTPISIPCTNPPAYKPALACAKTNFLPMWFTMDYFPPYQNGTRIAGKRASNEGLVLDTKEIFPASVKYSNILSHQIAFDGTNYFVVWSQRNDVGLPPSDFIYGVRISEAGVVLDAKPIPIKGYPPSTKAINMLFDGTCYRILTTHILDAHYFFLITQINDAGKVVHEDSISLASTIIENPVMTLGANGSSLIVFSGYEDSINNHPVNTMRIKGILYTPQNVGIQTVQKQAGKENYKITISGGISKRSLFLSITPLFTESQTSLKKTISVKMYTSAGKLIRDCKQTAPNNQSSYTIKLNENNSSSMPMPAGMYLIQIKIGNFIRTQRLPLF